MSHPEAIERLGGDAEDGWAGAASDEDLGTLARLLDRIPARLALVTRRCTIDGEMQRVVGADLGATQPAVCEWLRRARTRMAMVAALGVDVTPDEARALIRDAGEPDQVAALVGTYLREHTIEAARHAAGMSVGPARRCLLGGSWRRHPSLGGVARAVTEINAWEGVRGGARRGPRLH